MTKILKVSSISTTSSQNPVTIRSIIWPPFSDQQPGPEEDYSDDIFPYDNDGVTRPTSTSESPNFEIHGKFNNRQNFSLKFKIGVAGAGGLILTFGLLGGVLFYKFRKERNINRRLQLLLDVNNTNFGADSDVDVEEGDKKGENQNDMETKFKNMKIQDLQDMQGAVGGEPLESRSPYKYTLSSADNPTFQSSQSLTALERYKLM